MLEYSVECNQQVSLYPINDASGVYTLDKCVCYRHLCTTYLGSFRVQVYAYLTLYLCEIGARIEEEIEERKSIGETKRDE